MEINLQLNNIKLTETLRMKYLHKIETLEEENEALKKEVEKNEMHILDLQCENKEFAKELEMYHEECSSDKDTVNFEKNNAKEINL